MIDIKKEKLAEGDVLQRNEDTYAIIKEKREIAYKLYEEIDALEKTIICPCAYCGHEGFFRCMACEENNYRGFNRRCDA